MLFLFQGRHALPGRIVVGLVALVLGIVLHTVVLAVVGGLVLAWALYRVVVARRMRASDRPDR